MVQFVNPYTFVRQRPNPRRGAPPGHERLHDDRLCGSLRVTITARTPLLLRGFGNVAEPDLRPEEGGGTVADIPRRDDGTAIIPGSSLMGAVRSVHEVLSGGCLRVLNEDYVPIHRHPATAAETKPVQVAIVTAVDGAGHPTRVAVADETAWIPLKRLDEAADGPFSAGDRVTIDKPRFDAGNGRRVLEAGAVRRKSGMTVEADGSWVLLVTDTKARDINKGVFFVAGRIGSKSYPVDEAALDLFGRCVDNANDVREYRRDHQRKDPVWTPESKPEYVPVHWPPEGVPGGPGRVIGRRLPARPYFFPGQPVWVRVTNGTVTEIRLSQLWRFEGEGTVGERVGNARPCDNPKRLCPSCQVFGSIDPREEENVAAARQRGYRGHVRIDEAVADKPVGGVPWHLAPLSAPRPSAGQFYLENTGKEPAPKNSRPAALWGSNADKGGFRPIRGRKFYWRTRAPEQGEWPRGRARHRQSDELTARVRLVPTGTTFRTRVTFDNLTASQLGGLLTALDPRLLLASAEREVVTSAGGGKPFGFGAVTVDVAIDRLDTARSRYLGDDPAQWGIAELVDEFRTEVDPKARRELAAVLTLAKVDDERVWYPPGEGAKGEEAFDQGFESFWQRSTGITMSKEVRPLVTLKDPEEPDQQLPSRPRMKGPSRG